MPPALKDRASCAKFIVHCNGPCSGVNIWIDSSSGDPDLYALDTSWPIISSPPNCDNCRSFCQSIKSARKHSAGERDECTQLSTTEEQIYVLVYAFADYGDATITFENVDGDVEELPECGPGMTVAVLGAFVNTQQCYAIQYVLKHFS